MGGIHPNNLAHLPIRELRALSAGVGYSDDPYYRIINTGDIVRINTETGTYVERVEKAS